MRTAALVTVLLAGAAAAAPPPCSYQDLASPLTDYEDWSRTLLDTSFRLDAAYRPPDLASAGDAGFASEYQVRSLLIDDLRALGDAAREVGLALAIQSAYRSYDYQARTFQYWVDREGYQAALRSSARPGHSEHQLGTTLDFRAAAGPAAWELEDFAATAEGAWLAANAWRFGFVMSYPRAKEEETCYVYEPWHYRYVGREAARGVRERGLTLREWLWEQQP